MHKKDAAAVKSLGVKSAADAGAALKNHTTATSRLCVSVGPFRIEGTRVARRGRAVGLCFAFWFALQVSRPVLESRSDLLEDCDDAKFACG